MTRLFDARRDFPAITSTIVRTLAPLALLFASFFASFMFESAAAFNRPPHAETLCWIGHLDSGFRSTGNVICYGEEELPHGNAYICHGAHGGPTQHALDSCDPSWYGCSELPDYSVGTATASGKGFICMFRYRRVAESPCCAGGWQPYSRDKGTGKNTGSPLACGGNPIHLGTGNKYQREQDYLGAGPVPLRFEHDERGLERAIFIHPRLGCCRDTSASQHGWGTRNLKPPCEQAKQAERLPDEWVRWMVTRAGCVTRGR